MSRIRPAFAPAFAPTRARARAPTRAITRAITRVGIAVLAGTLAACASSPPLPAGIDLRQLTVEALAIEPDVQLEEAGWTSSAARTGGLAGASIGLGVGGMACVGAGLLAPLCLAALVPLTTTVGAVSGAAIGVAHSRSAPGVEDKHTLLEQEWKALAARAPLAKALQRQLEVPAAVAGAPAPRWRLQVGYATLGSIGRGLEQPFAIEATARLAVWRDDDPRTRFERSYAARAAEQLTLSQWRADDAVALRRALDTLSATLAAQMADDLVSATR